MEEFQGFTIDESIQSNDCFPIESIFRRIGVISMIYCNKRLNWFLATKFFRCIFDR